MLKSLKQKYLDQFQKVNAYLHKQVEAGVCDADNVSALNQLAYTQLYGTSSDKVNEYTISDKKYKVIDGQRVEDDVCWVKFASTEEELAQYQEIRDEYYFDLLNGREANADEHETDIYDEDNYTLPVIMGRIDCDTPFGACRIIHGERLPTIDHIRVEHQTVKKGAGTHLYEMSRLYVSKGKVRESRLPIRHDNLSMSLLSCLALGNPEKLDESFLVASANKKHVLWCEDVGFGYVDKGVEFSLIKAFLHSGSHFEADGRDEEKLPLLVSFNLTVKYQYKPNYLERMVGYAQEASLLGALISEDISMHRGKRGSFYHDPSGFLDAQKPGRIYYKPDGRAVRLFQIDEIEKQLGVQNVCFTKRPPVNVSDDNSMKSASVQSLDCD